jgi:hypothetical protein
MDAVLTVTVGTDKIPESVRTLAPADVFPGYECRRCRSPSPSDGGACGHRREGNHV